MFSRYFLFNFNPKYCTRQPRLHPRLAFASPPNSPLPPSLLYDRRLSCIRTRLAPRRAPTSWLKTRRSPRPEKTAALRISRLASLTAPCKLGLYLERGFTVYRCTQVTFSVRSRTFFDLDVYSSSHPFFLWLTSMRRTLVSYCLSLAYKFLRIWPRQKAR